MSNGDVVTMFFVVLCGLCSALDAVAPPNIVFILTDDQDVEIGGMTPLVKTKKLIGDAGISFKNMYVTSPLCCPSRSSILTGNYVHNNGALNNSFSGNCSSRAWQETSEKSTFVTYLKKQGYQTFFAGKYLNQYGFPRSGGVEHIPPGWDEWHGLVGNSVYYNYTLSVNGKAEFHGDKYSDDYLTDVIGKRAHEFLLQKRIESRNQPFFMMLSTPACHEPFTPADQYKKVFDDVKAPRNGSFNYYSPDRHWLLRQAKNPMGDESLKFIDSAYRNRWRTLLSVDDLTEQIINALEKTDTLNNTFVIFSSDNGYHLGQLSLPFDKRQMYEFDIHVPLMIRGPGIKSGQIRSETVLNIDFAPTFIDLAGISPIPPKIDGQSFKSLLFSNASEVSWREDFLVEHNGEFKETVSECPRLNHQQVANCRPDCVCEDSLNNTYGCIRVLNKKTNMVYCEFSDSENYVEVYDLGKDPFQLKNIAKQLDPKVHLELNQRLMKLSICSGPSCRVVHPYSLF